MRPRLPWYDFVKDRLDVKSAELANIVNENFSRARVSSTDISNLKSRIRREFFPDTVRQHKPSRDLDDIFLMNMDASPAEILSMIYSEDEDADVSYRWVAMRKHRLRKELGIVEPYTKKRDAACRRFDSIILANLNKSPSELSRIINTEVVDNDVTYGWLTQRRRKLKERRDNVDNLIAKCRADGLSDKDTIKAVYSRFYSLQYQWLLERIAAVDGDIEWRREYAQSGQKADNELPVVTVTQLSKAIKHVIAKGHYKEMSSEEATNLAYYILTFFGYNDNIIDNNLEPDDRDNFYMLEDSGLLGREPTEENTLYDGREWRTHGWRLEKRVISTSAEQYSERLLEQTAPEEDPWKALYNDDVWKAVDEHRGFVPANA